MENIKDFKELVQKEYDAFKDAMLESSADIVFAMASKIIFFDIMQEELCFYPETLEDIPNIVRTRTHPLHYLWTRYRQDFDFNIINYNACRDILNKIKEGELAK